MNKGAFIGAFIGMVIATSISFFLGPRLEVGNLLGFFAGMSLGMVLTAIGLVIGGSFKK